MKKFKYRLEGVLRVRRLQEEYARARLLAANHDVQLAAMRVAARRDRYDQLARPLGSSSLDELQRARFGLEQSAAAIVWAEDQRRAAADVARAAHEDWAAAEQRVRALQRLRERAQEAHRREVQRDDDRLADDLATIRYRNRAIAS
jgi:flagellar FliJ protein